jgi:GT2 family glycosyltransferase
LAIEEIQPGQSIGLGRDQTLVCVPVYGFNDLVEECLQRLFKYTQSSVILVADDATPGQEVRQALTRLLASGLRVVYSRQDQQIGVVGNNNAAVLAGAPADVALVNSDCLVSDHWLEGLRDAAYSGTRVATSTALTNNGTIVSVPGRNRPSSVLPAGHTVDTAAAAVRAASKRIHPEIPTAISHCTYVRRAAIEDVGAFDMAFSPGYGDETDFSLRCATAGWRHVVADDVFVFHVGKGSFGHSAELEQLRREHEDLLVTRYPGFPAAVYLARESITSPFALALTTAGRALTGRGGLLLPPRFGKAERLVLMLRWRVRRALLGNRVAAWTDIIRDIIRG